MKFVIFPGLGKKPSDEWYKHISSELKKQGQQSVVLNLPSSFKPNLYKTYKYLTKMVKVNSATVLIGHSSGASLILGILQKLPSGVVVKKAVLVAGFINPNLTKLLHTYVPKRDYDNLFPSRWNWKKIKNSAEDFIIIYSSDDPYVQTHHALDIHSHVGGKLVKLEKCGHFGVRTGGKKFREFKDLLRYISK